ncbi:uncharacterized protein LOC113510840 [Galleria mellonella]|uniref:Uncharacterized protein LOC113510840 n=1 Tax=Galleria mellonella TaxID=7137 RepID=A0ABM3MM85_GALME|nr:uncharacterized protein LOC113510840 [Galleria mellonella]
MLIRTFTWISLIATLDCVRTEIAEYSLNNTEMNEYEGIEHSKMLSRRKRYLTFPDGSSFQLVFCAQNQGYLPIAHLMWFGNTAALAWELPTDPKFLYSLKKYEKGYKSNRRQDISKHIYYLDEYGKVIGKVPYKRKPIVNPAFAKRSVDNIQENKRKISIIDMHNAQKRRDYLNNIDESSIEFHRGGRKDLYEKLETLLDGLGWNGRECILRFLCESGKRKNSQGTFLDEIMRATFTLPRGVEFASATHRQYDDAHGTDGDCAVEYPQCEDLHGLQLYDN